MNPFEVVKVRMQSNRAKAKEAPSTWAVARQIAKEDGWFRHGLLGELNDFDVGFGFVLLYVQGIIVRLDFGSETFNKSNRLKLYDLDLMPCPRRHIIQASFIWSK